MVADVACVAGVVDSGMFDGCFDRFLGGAAGTSAGDDRQRHIARCDGAGTAGRRSIHGNSICRAASRRVAVACAAIATEVGRSSRGRHMGAGMSAIAEPVAARDAGDPEDGY